MTTERSLQEQMDAAFENYFPLSKMLISDLRALLGDEHEDQHWRRNFVRASAALIEGYAHCLREIGVIRLKCGSAPELSTKEMKVLLCESSFDANERVKYILKAAYKFFELSPAPNFGGAEWARAQRVLRKRHRLMHPKILSDLEVPNESWEEMREDVDWLFKQFFGIFEQLQRRHGESS